MTLNTNDLSKLLKNYMPYFRNLRMVSSVIDS